MSMISRWLFPTLIHYLFHYPFTAAVVVYLSIRKSLNQEYCANKAVKVWSLTLFRSLGKKIEVSGLENLKSSSNRVVVINHASLFDIPAIMTVLESGSFIGRRKLLDIPLFGNVLKTLNYIAIDSNHIRQSINALEEGIWGISKGRSIIMFPEGTRTLDGHLLPFKRGFVKILRKSGADLLPVTLDGFFNLKSKYSKKVDVGEELSIVIHKPIKAEELISLNDRQIMDRTKQIIASAFTSNKENI